MRFIVSLKSALRSLKNNSKRSMLTMLGIIIGIASVIAILSIGKGFERDTLSKMTENTNFEDKINVDFIPTDTNLYETNNPFFNNADITSINSIEGIKQTEYAKSTIDSLSKSIPIKNTYKSKQIGLVLEDSYEVLVGRSIKIKDSTQKNRVAIIDLITATELYGSPEEAINNSIILDDSMFVIIGVYDLQEDSESINLQTNDNIQVPKETYNFFLGEDKEITRLTVSLQEGADASYISKKIISTLENNGYMREMGKYQIFNEEALTESMKSILKSVTYFISAVAGISLIIAGVGIMNMMYISVYERTREIAIKRALGFTKRNILYQFLIEGVILTTIGGVIGYLVGVIFANLVGELINIPIIFDFSSIILSIGISSLIGIVFSIVPAYEASNKSLIEILK